MSSSNFYNPQNDGVGFSKRWDYLHKTTRIFFEGFHTLFFYTVLSFRAFVCFAVSFVVVCSCFLFVSRFRLWLFCGCSDSILFDFFFFVILFGGCCFVCTFAYKKGLVGPVTRRLETVQASAGYQDLSFIIPKTTGFGFSKRWVSFHKTTPILFEGFSHPSFFRSGA